MDIFNPRATFFDLQRILRKCQTQILPCRFCDQCIIANALKRHNAQFHIGWARTNLPDKMLQNFDVITMTRKQEDDVGRCLRVSVRQLEDTVPHRHKWCNADTARDPEHLG